MNPLIFKLGLPLLLGYTLYVGLSGRFTFHRRPTDADARPAWFLGLWTGVCTALAVSLSLHMADRMPIERVPDLVKPTAWLLGMALLPGLLGYVAYRRSVRQASIRQHRDEVERIAESLDVSDIPRVATHADDTSFELAVFAGDDDPMALPMSDAADESSAPSLDITPEQVSIEAFEIALDDIDIQETGTPDVDADIGAVAAVDVATVADTGTATDTIAETDAGPVEALVAESNEIAEIAEIAKTRDRPAYATALPADIALRELEPSESELALREQLQQETVLREELEKHLRITRRALSTLESESRDFESAKAEALIELEDALDARIRQTAAAEALAARESAARVNLETSIVNLKQDLLEAKREMRRSTAARAQALGSANKAITLARQTMQARHRAEYKLREARELLANRQETISSLIGALEKEKRRTQDEVASLAKQLVLKERQLESRRSLDEAARNVEDKLTSRLVKKVAKARPAQTS